MAEPKLLRLVLPFLRGIALAMLTSGTVLASPSPVQGVHITPIGSPTWKSVDFHLFSAPVGTSDSGYAEFGGTMLALLRSPRHEPHPDLGAGPLLGLAYDLEQALNVRRQPPMPGAINDPPNAGLRVGRKSDESVVSKSRALHVRNFW